MTEEKASEPGPERRLPVSRRLVGRIEEMQSLHAWLNRAGTERGGLGLVRGPAGIGKSFLLREFARVAQEQGWAIGWGHVETGSRSQLPWPWPTILRNLPGEQCKRLSRELSALALENLARGENPDAALSGGRLEGGQLAFRLAEAVRDSAEKRPTLLVIDDAQRLDALSVATLRLVAEVGDELPLLLVTATRPDDSGASADGSTIVTSTRPDDSGASADGSTVVTSTRPDDSGASADGSTTKELEFQAREQVLELGPLSGDELSSILGDRLTLRLGGQEAAVALTSGSPLLASELRESSKVSVDATPSREDLDGGLQSLALNCLQSLDADSRSLVEVAALLEEGFDAGLLARILNRDLSAVERSLGSSTVSGFIVVNPGSGSSTLRFAHELLAETVEASIDPASRRRLHARLAEEFGKRRDRKITVDPAVIAYHACRGVPAFAGHRAARWAHAAAVQANRGGSPSRALDWVRQGLEALELDHESSEVSIRIDLLVERFAASQRTDQETALASLYRAQELARELGPDELARLSAAASEVDAGQLDGPLEIRRAVATLVDSALVAYPDPGEVRTSLLARKAFARFALPGPHSLAQSNDAVREAYSASTHLPQASGARVMALSAALWCDPWGDTLKDPLAVAEELERLSAHHEGAVLLSGLCRVTLVLEHYARGDLAAASAASERIEEMVQLTSGHPLAWLPFQHRAARAAMGCDAAAVRQALEAGFEATGPSFYAVAHGAAMVLQFHLIEIFGPTADFGWKPPEGDGLSGGLGPGLLATSEFLADAHPASAPAAIRAGVLKGIAPQAPDIVRTALDEMVRNDFVDFPRDRSWLAATCLLAETCGIVEHEEASSRLLGLLRPFEGRFAATEFALSFAGHVSGYLATLAAICGRYEEADAFSRRAIQENDRLGLLFFAARCRLERARVLFSRADPGRLEEARALAAQGKEMVARYAMAGLEPWIQALPDEEAPISTSPSAPSSPEPPSTSIAGFWREGDVWTLRWEGREVRVKNQRGLEFLHILVCQKGVSVHARELMNRGEISTEQRVSAGSDDLAVADDGGLEVVDQTALRAYRTRLKDLDEEIAEAEQGADRGRLETLGAEKDALLEAVRGSTGLGGRLRKTGSDAERARTAVRKRIKASLDRIREELPALHVHLSASLRTGVICAYEPVHAPAWQTTRPEN